MKTVLYCFPETHKTMRSLAIYHSFFAMFAQAEVWITVFVQRREGNSKQIQKQKRSYSTGFFNRVKFEEKDRFQMQAYCHYAGMRKRAFDRAWKSYKSH